MRANLRSDPKSIDRSYQLASRSRYASRTINLGPSPPPSRQSDRNIGAEPVRGGGVVSRGPRIPTPWIESAQCGRFQFVSRSPRGNEGKKKERRNEREEYWPRCKNGSGPIAKRGGGGGRVLSARCHIPLVGLPGFKSVLLGFAFHIFFEVRILGYVSFRVRFYVSEFVNGTKNFYLCFR